MMWRWLGWLSGKVRGKGRSVSEHTAFLARYKHLRQVGLQFNNRLVQSIPKSVLDEGGKKLGILKKGVLVLDSEDEIAVLMDYCIYDVQRQGRNTVERYLVEFPPAPDSDEMVLLKAMCEARYSLFAVEAVESGIGVHVRDLLRDEPHFIVDIGFSRTAPIGMILAARIMAPEGIAMTTGAALPVGVLSAADRATFLRQMVATLQAMDFRHPSRQKASELAATIIRRCLEHGAAERIQYIDPRSRRGPDRAPAAPPSRSRIGRNDPCPCGSGRKFKNCCAARK
jgi:hypothetical protein